MQPRFCTYEELKDYISSTKTCWNNFNEGNDLPQVIENYFRRYGCYPTAVLADKLYQTRNNRNYCKARGIRLSGPALGRKSKAAKEENNAQMYQDACDRNVIEGKNGTAKRRYGLNCIMSKLDETSKTEAGFSILMMNAWKRVYKEHLHDILHFMGMGSIQYPSAPGGIKWFILDPAISFHPGTDDFYIGQVQAAREIHDKLAELEPELQDEIVIIFNDIPLANAMLGGETRSDNPDK